MDANASYSAAPSSAAITYPHDDAITSAISGHADVRVVWGGDATVARIRAIPLPPRGIEVTFADRYSFAALDARAYLDLDDRAQEQLAEDFVSDTFPFDQAACSSPQLVVWRGRRDDVAEASDAFYRSSAAAAERRGYGADASLAMRQTLAAAKHAADHRVITAHRYGRPLCVVEVATPEDVTRDVVGGGYLLSLRVESLKELIPYLSRRDQTLAAFGFGAAELVDFARGAAAAGGIDRIVPIGRALAFDRLWDGFDLLSAFTRTVPVIADSRGRRVAAGEPGGTWA